MFMVLICRCIMIALNQRKIKFAPGIKFQEQQEENDYYFSLFQTQTLLSLLAEVDNLHIIASIDHINAPLSKY